MTIEVKVLNGKIKSKTRKGKQPKILTPDYVRQLNKCLSEKIISNQNQNEIAVRTLSKRIFR